jgi:hypothetical protein
MVTATSITREAPFLEDFRRRLLQGGFDLTKQAQPGTTPREIAGLDALQTGAMDQYARSLGIDPKTGMPTGTGAQFDPYFSSGIASLNQATKQFDPSQSNYQQFSNQYQADVTQEALKQMDQEAQKAQNQMAGDSVLGGTFGGSRYGVQAAEMATNLQDIKSRRIFQDLAQNFEQAQGKAMSTFENQQQRNLAAAPQFAGMGAQQFGLQSSGLGALQQFGGLRRAQKQEGFNETFRQAEDQRMQPYNRLSYFGDLMAGIPSVSQTMTSKPSPYTNPILGGIGMGLGAYGMMNQS